ncbi:hypothetical protein LTR10_010564 [Elasticomyces elasticus]|nr:hypothetical protein LTR10_010564 [Elasticomyces elasticus]KAK4972464.1 hypothetical protein LTR42_006974 [Elasticomyces elasticus]
MNTAAQTIAVPHLRDPESIHTSTAVTSNAVTNTVHVTAGCLGNFPHELLMKIFRHLLVRDEQPIKLESAELRAAIALYRSEEDPQPLRWRDLDLFLVCKAFYYAGIEVYFGANSFNLNGPLDVLDFSEAVGLDRKRHIKSARMEMFWTKEDGYERFCYRLPEGAVKEACSAYTSLREVYVVLSAMDKLPAHLRASFGGYLKRLCVPDGVQYSWKIDQY